MWVVLCDPGDYSAQWTYAQLGVRGLAPLELISPEELVLSPRSTHRIDRDGAHFEIDLPDGRTLASNDVHGMLNRATEVPTIACLAQAPQSDARYAGAELAALLLSWLSSIGGVSINRPTARGLAGAWRTAAEWAILAARSGLTVPPLALSSGSVVQPAFCTAKIAVIVLGDHIFGAELAPNVARASCRLARLSETELLGIEFHLDSDDQATFAGATPLPDLCVGGDAFIDALHDHLLNTAARRK